MESIRNLLRNQWILLVVVVLGLSARMAAATLGHNYDMGSWYVVADITRYGGNVYAETDRYNYGPVWFLILHGLDGLAGHHHPQILRYLIPGLLSLADLGIFLFLCRRVGRLAGLLFFLNPISILITGYHNQFDNLAILLALWSVQLLGEDFETPINRRKMIGLLALGLSLTTKHLFFAFPFWLALKQKGTAQKLIVLLVPIAVFLLGFTPYWFGGFAGIVGHVFCYVPVRTNYFYAFFVPRFVQNLCDGESLWYLMLVLFAFVCRPRGSFESLLVYTGVLVAFSASTVNQYLAIPVVLVAVFPNWLFLGYTMAGTLQILGGPDGPLLLKPASGHYGRLAIWLLAAGLVWRLWGRQLRRLFQAAGREIDLQVPKLRGRD